MRIEAGPCCLRRLALEDAAPMAVLADNPAVACNLRDLFPAPYRVQDALEFIMSNMFEDPVLNWAVEVDGELAGVVGCRPGIDVYRRSAEVGYWLGERFWGRGIATAAVVALSRHLFATQDFERLFAGVFAGNPASAKVLEKAGFRHEGTMRRHIIKDGVVRDELMYGLIRSDIQ